MTLYNRKEAAHAAGLQLDQGERKPLEMIIKEILLYLPMDEESRATSELF
ncbi:MAG: hypothetical protein GY754_16720 [bacterium]|nr:hypothetical protein [bacterium]